MLRSHTTLGHIGPLLALMVIGSFATGCAPKVSQWVQVVDCAQKHVVVPNARVRVYWSQDALEAPAMAEHEGKYAEGGASDAQGNTWASFFVHRRNAVKGFVQGGPAGTPVTDVPANPNQPIYTCVNR